jgi:four helix bundle protein
MEDPGRDTSAVHRLEVRDFTHLTVWKAARALRKNICLVCRGFPKQETSELSSQMRRAAVSTTANLAEGYGRFSYQENIQFCRQSRGSVYEIRDHLTTALDAGYITPEQYKQFDLQAISVIKLINGYLRATTQRQVQSAGRKSAKNDPPKLLSIFPFLFSRCVSGGINTSSCA